MFVLTPDTRQKGSLEVTDGVIYDKSSFPVLQEAQIAARTLEEVDDLMFIHQFSQVMPLAIRHVSIHPAVQNENSPDFKMPGTGHMQYGQRLMISRPGLVAIKQQGDEPEAGSGGSQVGYIEDTYTIPTTTYSDEKVAPVRTNLTVYAIEPVDKADTDNGTYPEPLYAVWDETNDKYVPFQTGAASSSLDAKYWYISEFRETFSYTTGTDGNGDETTTTKSAPVVVPAKRYPHLVAQDFYTEPFYYMLGYTYPQNLQIHHNHDKLHETVGEYAWFYNQLTRMYGKREEDARLAHAYSLEANFINNPFSVEEALRPYPGPSKTARTKFTNGIERAQQVSRRTDGVYAPIVHPFDKPSTAFPFVTGFSQKLHYTFTGRPMSSVVVNPGGEDSRKEGFTYDNDDILIRRTNSKTGMEYQNEELQRMSMSLLPSSKRMENADDKIKTRMEIVIVTLSEEESSKLTQASLTNVHRQLQTFHKTVSSQEQQSSSYKVNVEQEIQAHGFITNYLVVGRQTKAMKRNMRLDLTTFADDVAQEPIPAIYTVMYSYAGSQRSQDRQSQKGTSTHLMRHLYEQIPPDLPPHSVHILTASVSPKTAEIAGVSAANSTRAVIVNHTLANGAFQYKDPFRPEEASVDTDIIISVYAETVQVLQITNGLTFRSFSTANVQEPSI